MAYRVGDIVNGQRLGEDHQWYPVAPEDPASTQALAATGSAEPSGPTSTQVLAATGSAEPSDPTSTQLLAATGSAQPSTQLLADIGPAQPSEPSGPEEGTAAGTPAADDGPWYTRWWAFALLALVLFVVALGVRNVRNTMDTSSATNLPVAEAAPESSAPAAPAPAPPAPVAPAPPAASATVAPPRASASVAPPRATAAPTPARPAPAVTVPAAPPPAAPPAAARTGGLNTPVRDAILEFTVSSVQCGQSQVGSQLLHKLAQGQFCLVTLAVTNTGTQAYVFDGAHQKADDGQGQTVGADTEAAWYVEDSQAFLEPITPGKQARGTIVFDLPKTSSIAQLHLHDSAGSSGARVKVA